MHFAKLSLVVAACFMTAGLRAGSYPSGTSAQNFSYSDGTTDLSDGSRIAFEQQTPDGSVIAAVYKSALRLASQTATNAIGSFKLPDLDPGNVVKSFDLKFSVMMTAPAGPGEGWSVNFGQVPEDNGTGEGGFVPLPHGLSIAFDTLDNGEDPASIEVLVGGVSIGEFPRTFTFDQVLRVVTIHWDSFGLDLSYDNKVICTDLATPGFSPGVGDTFAFSARNTAAAMDVFIDALKATTQATTVLNTGGPIISEFVANNDDFEDEFADKPGWIEIFNGSPDSIDLTGWYLTDSKKNLTKWRIAGATLTPYNYLVVFASGLDRQLSATSFLHTSFTISKNGGYVALVRPDGSVASSYEYGPQEVNVSFGEMGPERKQGYMFPASPGVMNAQEPATSSFSPDVQFSHPGGITAEPVVVDLSAPGSPGTEIRYTLDRTEPGTNSPLYSGSLTITQFTTIKARSYSPGHLPGRVSSRTYVMVDGTLTNYAETGKIFESNLPLIFVDSFGVNVDSSTGGARPFRPSYALVIPPDPVTGRASLTNRPDYAGPSGIHVRGESSAGFDQRSYALELHDETGEDFDASLLGMPSDSDWVLYGPWSEKTLMRNKLIFDWMRALRGNDGSAVRTRFVELFFNQTKPTSGRIGFSSYRGIYVLMEKLKRGDDRVPIEKVNQKTVDPELITGGYIIRKDKPDSLKSNWVSSRGVNLQSFDPDRLNTNQLAYIKGYINTFEAALNGTGYRDFTKGYQAYIDGDTFIDAQWMLELAKQVDGYVFSTYWHKDRGGRLRAGPLWDFNIALGNADYGTGDTPTGWLYGTANGAGQIWYPRLHTDPDYKLAHWDRYWELRRGIWSNEAVMEKINENMRTLLDGYSGLVSNRAPASIQNPAARHFRRWPRLGIRDWPNPPAESSIRTYQAEVGYMTNWIKTRFAWLDDQSLRISRTAYRPPVFSHQGGVISAPIELTMESYKRTDPSTTFATGEIYYTMDNSDPRLPGGAINPSARRYQRAVVVDSSLTVNARLYDQRQWSPLATATFLLDAAPANSSNLVIAEIMFRPAGLTAAETNAALVNPQGFEFVELRNVSAGPVDLTGVRFTRGLDFDFSFVRSSARLLQPGESVVIASDPRAARVRYPHVAVEKIVGQFRGHLDSGGETIRLEAADGSAIQEFRYDDDSPWPDVSDIGRSLVLQDPALDPNKATAWIASAKSGGTPGESGTGSDLFSGDPGRDRDGDGLSDIFEFASGSDPENPASGFYPEVKLVSLEMNGTIQSFINLEYTRRPSAQGIRFSVDQTEDFSHWTASEAMLALASSRTNLNGLVTDTYVGTSSVSGNPSKTSFYRVTVRQQ